MDLHYVGRTAPTFKSALTHLSIDLPAQRPRIVPQTSTLDSCTVDALPRLQSKPDFTRRVIDMDLVDMDMNSSRIG